MEESERSAPLTPSEPRGFGGCGAGRVRAGQSSGEAIPEAGIHLHPAGAWDGDGLSHLSQSLTGDVWDWGHRGIWGCAEGQGVSMTLVHEKGSLGILGMCRRSGSVHDPCAWKGKFRDLGMSRKSGNVHGPCAWKGKLRDLGMCRKSGSIHDSCTWKGKLRNFGSVQRVRRYP